MLRQVHFYMKGALRSIAAPSTKVTNAGQTGLVQMQPVLTQHLLAVAAMIIWP